MLPTNREQKRAKGHHVHGEEPLAATNMGHRCRRRWKSDGVRGHDILPHATYGWLAHYQAGRGIHRPDDGKLSRERERRGNKALRMGGDTCPREQLQSPGVGGTEWEPSEEAVRKVRLAKSSLSICAPDSASHLSLLAFSPAFHTDVLIGEQS